MFFVSFLLKAKVTIPGKTVINAKHLQYPCCDVNFLEPNRHGNLTLQTSLVRVTFRPNFIYITVSAVMYLEHNSGLT